MGTFAEKAGAAAYKVAATLEFAGCRAQQDLLQHFNGPFGEKLGGLLYLLSIITALIILASGGSYRYGLYLLVGPPLFYLMISQRTVVPVTHWQFGVRVHPDDAVITTGDGVTPQQANVSTFFALWNRLTSQTVQELIKVLDLTQDKSDLHFVSSTDRYLAFWNRTNADRDLEYFIQMGLVTPCIDYFMLLRFINDPNIPELRKTGARQVLERHAGRNAEAFFVSRNLWFIDWYNSTFLSGTPTQNASYQALAPNPERTYSCQDMWIIGVSAIRKTQAQQALEQMCAMGLPEGFTQSDCIARIRLKFGQLIERGRTLDGNRGAADDAAQTTNLMLNELSGRILFNSFYRRAAPLMRLNLGDHPDWEHSRVFGEARYSQETAHALRTMQEGEEYTSRGEIIAAAINLPYFQGMLLYFLAWTFPFFALMLVVPGRESGFLTWMGLWAWAKLWDLGMAIVVMIDNMLYALLPHGAPMTDAALNDPGRAMKVLFQTDPMYSAHTYYTLLSGCILSIPAIMGLLVKRGGGDLVAAVSQGLKDFPNDFGRAMGGRQRALLANEQWGLGQQYIHNEVVASAWSSVMDRQGVMLPLMEAAAIRMSDNVLRDSIRALRANPTNANLSARAFEQFRARAPQLMHALNGLAATSAQETGLAKMRYNMQMSAYRASTSSYVTQRAQNAIYQRWNTHDFRREYPGAAFVQWMQAEAIFDSRWQGTLQDTIFNQEIGVWNDALGHLKDLNVPGR